MYTFVKSTTLCALHAAIVDDCGLFWRQLTIDQASYCLSAFESWFWTRLRLVGCLEPDFGSCLHHLWSTTTELSHRLLHNCSTLWTSICGALEFATHRWTQISVKLVKHLLLLSLRCSLEVVQLWTSLSGLLFYLLIFTHVNDCLPITLQRIVWLNSKGLYSHSSYS